MKKFNIIDLVNIAYDDYDGITIVKTIEGEHSRWTQHMTTIFKLDDEPDKFYALEWERGLTECQEDEFFSMPYEVEPKEEVITIIKYIPKKKGE